MATSKSEEMCIVNGEYLMTMEDGLQLLRLLTKAVAVTRNWGNTGALAYKYTKESSKEQTLTMVSNAMLAAMELEKDAV